MPTDSRWRPIRKLNAPPGYRWTDDDVLHEKNDAFWDGIVVGLIAAWWIAVVVIVIARAIG